MKGEVGVRKEFQEPPVVAPSPSISEPARVREIAGYALDDWDGDARFDAIVELLRDLCDVPIALVSLVESERQRFLGKAGLEATETPRSMSFCAHAMLLPQIMVVPDATRDPRFADNPLVTGDLQIRFYAGAPLVSRSGIPLGALCVIDTVPRDGLTPLQTRTLQVLATNVVTILDARREAEARALIAQELAHRIKNLFTVVSGLIHFSAREGDAEAGRKLLLDRISALAAAHELVIPGTATADGARLSLRAVMARIFAPYALERERVRIEGDDVDLDPNIVTGMALVLHEMATNAVKYGALALADGVIDIDVRLTDAEVAVHWRERAGKRLDPALRDSGFGTRLVDTVITRQLMGSIVRSWDSDGLAVHIRFPHSTPVSSG